MPGTNKVSRRDTCPICLDHLVEAGARALAGHVVRLRACGHYFHRECINDWLQNAHTCPTCRVQHPEVPMTCINLGSISLSRADAPEPGTLSPAVETYIEAVVEASDYSQADKQKLRLRGTRVELFAPVSSAPSQDKGKGKDKPTHQRLLNLRLENLISYHSLREAVILMEQVDDDGHKRLVHHIFQFESELSASRCVGRLRDASTAVLEKLQRRNDSLMASTVSILSSQSDYSDVSLANSATSSAASSTVNSNRNSIIA
ncbi:uncharacterized protein MONBRDRAFT_36490 [Monosiga brevicollis MX1]|uniref:RING-type domain-containing protein n=1 Tax=Monosiga brevicollis TaxID=81824 RepID=A9UVJ4_MONBE|nr:uncharacterized protein MONBRDRAFT_36490 [Monosiga brevicollis MX1]EDQ90592.1 predicted protein [Monosiga brevicollis MX1]|eukprot:XP_001744643.1 hypothetical protein [Monosiga brevicollis MX1]